MKQRVKGLFAIILIGVLVVGPPTALVWVGKDYFPTSVPSSARIWEVLSQPDDGTLVVGVLLVASWLAWAYLMVGVLAEIWAALRRVQAPKLPGFSLPQGMARKLVGVAMLAVATVPALAGTSHASPGSGTVPAAAPGASIVQTSTTETPQASTPTVISHQVGPGDTLFSIAERYWGDGWLYPTLFEVNRDITQSNGKPLDDPGLIIDGTVLSVPVVPPTGPNTIQYSITQQDTPSSVAMKVLGSQDREPEIQALLKDGSLHPGEVLSIPVSAPAAVRPPTAIEAPAPATASPQTQTSDATETSGEKPVPEATATSSPEATQTPADAATPSATSTPTSAQEPTLEQGQSKESKEDSVPAQTATPLPEQSAKPAPAAETHPAGETGGPSLVEQISNAAATLVGVENGWPTRTSFGVGGVLAGGLVSLISVRRGIQRRQRARGVEVLMPLTAASSVEQELRTVGDPLAISEVAKALGGLAAYFAAQGGLPPQIRAARLSDEIFELYLVEPVRLPAPWVGTSDQLIWAYQGQEIEDADVGEVPAPYPALVTIGQDERGAHILLDLEQVGELRVAGPEDLTREVLAAMAVELATSSWADDLTVTLVGGFATMEDVLQTGRIRYLPTVGRLIEALTARAASDREALAQADLAGAHHARVLGREPGTWFPEVIMLLNPLTSDQQEQLNQILDANPRVAVAMIQANDKPSEWVLELVSPTLGLVEPLKLAISPQRIETAAYDQILDIVDTTTRQPEHNAMAPTVVAVLEEAQALIDQPPGNRSEEESAVSSDFQVSAEPVVMPRVGPQPDQPYLRLLGPVGLLNAPGPVDPSLRARLTEYLAYLMLTHEVTPECIDEAIWPNSANQNADMVRGPATSRLGKWLGTTVEDVPRLETRTYKVDDVGCDWNDFVALTIGDLTRTPTQHLEAAVGLVDGPLFSWCVGRTWAWAEPHRQQMIARITDTCYELAIRQLMAEQYLECETTLVVGLDVEPGDEQLWRMRILAAHARHNSQAVTEAMNRLYAQLGPLDSLDPETEQFLEAVKKQIPVAELMEML